MKTMYAALLTLITEPVEWYSLATSGVAARTVVLDTGDRKAQNDRTATMMAFRRAEKRPYISSPAS